MKKSDIAWLKCLNHTPNALIECIDLSKAKKIFVQKFEKKELKRILKQKENICL